MISKDQIVNDLKSVALNNNYKGSATEMIIDLLAYSLYNEQVQIISAIRESNISTATLISSKISQAMNSMYSVYRGKNPRVQLHFINNTLLSYNKLGLIYKSNTFSIYSESSITIQPSIQTTTGSTEYTLTGILSSNDKYECSVEITDDNRYYVDAIIDDEILSDLSEDVRVTINDVEYPTTRSFYDHMHQPISTSKLDSLFVLTIPGYGIRIYKKGYIDSDGNLVGYFKPNDVIDIQCLKYTKLEDLNTSELSSIVLSGTELTDFTDTTISQSYKGIALTDEVAREDESSILYNINYYSRIQSEILSNSDVNVLFSEYFIDSIYSSANEYDSSNDKMTIYYILKDGSTDISTRVGTWLSLYKSYFITSTISPIKCHELDLYVDIEVYINDNEDILNDVSDILSEYESKINLDTSKPLLNSNLIIAKINKLSNVSYVSKYYYEGYYTDESDNWNAIDESSSSDTLVPIRSTDGTPYYYNITPNITYKYTYETVSE